MNKRFCLSLLIAGTMLFLSLVPVFAKGQAAGSQKADATAWNDAPLADVKPVPQLPASPKKIPASRYAYDDLSKHVTIEILGHHYGVLNSNPDPIAEYLGKKYNAKITYTSIASSDYNTVLSTRFAAQDVPDVIVINTKPILEQLYEQNLLLDAKLPMRYMPNYAQYFTEDYQNFASYKDGYVAIPRYPIQGAWNPFIRKDWMAKLNLQAPKTIEDLLNYARAVSNRDPDGNGRKDTWFAGGAGNGRGFGMLDTLRNCFGNPDYNIKNGKINNMFLDGSMREFLSFLRTLYAEGLLAPDWYTVDWESFKSYSLNDKVGYVNYPVADLHMEQMTAKGASNKPNDASWVVWEPLAPLGTGRAGAPPGPAYLFAFPAKLQDDPVKLKRITHILDNSLYAGEDYFETIQGGGNKVFGREVVSVIENPDGTSFYSVIQSKHPTWTGELDTTGLANAGWQTIGLAGPPWHLRYIPGNDAFNNAVNQHSVALATYQRWPNNFKVQLDPDTRTDLNEFEIRELPKFVFGDRSLDTWDTFVKEWLNAGGRKALTTAASQMGTANFE